MLGFGLLTVLFSFGMVILPSHTKLQPTRDEIELKGLCCVWINQFLHFQPFIFMLLLDHYFTLLSIWRSGRLESNLGYILISMWSFPFFVLCNLRFSLFICRIGLQMALLIFIYKYTDKISHTWTKKILYIFLDINYI